MSVLPSAVDLQPDHDTDAGLRFPARVFFWCAVAAAVAAAMPLVPRLSETGGWGAFAFVGTASAVAQLFSIRTRRDQSYDSATLFLIVGVLLLPPELVLLLPVVQHVPEWLKLRSRWYIQSFNLCNYTLGVLGSWAAAHLVTTRTLGDHANLRLAAAGVVACLVLVAVNHVLLALMLKLARGQTLRETGLFDLENLTTEFVVCALGVAMFALWQQNKWLIPFGIAPLVLIHRSLSVPQLQAEARVDPKTGLFNARHFASALAEELGRAQRFERPLSLIMADLDLLRDVNNTYGHLAGDAVLKGVADVFRAELRHYDVPARFGGEEFSILLPETPPEQALEIAERIRRAVAERPFDVATSSGPIHATISIGVAGFPTDGADANELVHRADVAVYQAKLQGRNRVLAASSEPLPMPGARQGGQVAVPGDDEPVARGCGRRPE